MSLLGKHRDGFSDTRSVTAYESTKIPHAVTTFTAKYDGVEEKISFGSLDPLHVLNTVTGGCAVCCCFAGDPDDGSKDTAVEHSVAIHVDPSENSVKAFQEKNGDLKRLTVLFTIIMIHTELLVADATIAHDALTNHLLQLLALPNSKALLFGFVRLILLHIPQPWLLTFNLIEGD